MSVGKKYPNNEILTYSITDKNGYKKYKSNPDKSVNYLWRKETIERIFEDCKEHHNLRFTRIRRLLKNEQNTTIIFVCHNLNKWRIEDGKILQISH